MIAEVALGEWLPDLADYKNPGVVVCDNCYPSSGGYSPFLGVSGAIASVTGEVRGAFRAERYDGTSLSIVGTDSDLFVIEGATVTASGLGLTLAAGVRWTFEQFNAQIWAFAYNQAPHYIADIGSGSTFAPHPGVAPKASSVERVGDFLVTGNMVDIDASEQPFRVRWSQFNNPAGDYGTDLKTQSGFVDFPQAFGPVMGIFGGRNDVVLQKYAVSRITYVGGSVAFRRDTIEEQRGCVALGSAVTVGTVTYFLASDGFCRTDGATVEVISTGRVFDWFLENSDLDGRETIQGTVDWANRCVVWSFIPANSQIRNRQIIYSFDQERWSTASLEIDYLFPAPSGGVTLEELAATSTDLDAMDISLDSGQFKGSDRALSGFVGSDLVSLTGDALEAQWETGDFQPETGYRVCAKAIYPLVENQETNTQFEVGSRAVYKGGPVDWSAQVSVQSGGYAPIIKDGRYLRSRMTIPAASVWDKAVGMQVEYNVSGRT